MIHVLLTTLGTNLIALHLFPWNNCLYAGAPQICKLFLGWNIWVVLHKFMTLLAVIVHENTCYYSVLCGILNILIKKHILQYIAL